MFKNFIKAVYSAANHYAEESAAQTVYNEYVKIVRGQMDGLK